MATDLTTTNVLLGIMAVVSLHLACNVIGRCRCRSRVGASSVPS